MVGLKFLVIKSLKISRPAPKYRAGDVAASFPAATCIDYCA
jgi:hypothetical protein